MAIRLRLAVASVWISVWGVGYVSRRYMDYRVEGGHSIWESTHRRKYLGPTGAGVSLVWLLWKGGGK